MKKNQQLKDTLIADTDSNHYKIIGTWDLTDYSDYAGGTFANSNETNL